MAVAIGGFESRGDKEDSRFSAYFQLATCMAGPPVGLVLSILKQDKKSIIVCAVLTAIFTFGGICVLAGSCYLQKRQAARIQNSQEILRADRNEQQMRTQAIATTVLPLDPLPAAATRDCLPQLEKGHESVKDSLLSREPESVQAVKV